MKSFRRVRCCENFNTLGYLSRCEWWWFVVIKYNYDELFSVVEKWERKFVGTKNEWKKNNNTLLKIYLIIYVINLNISEAGNTSSIVVSCVLDSTWESIYFFLEFYFELQMVIFSICSKLTLANLRLSSFRGNAYVSFRIYFSESSVAWFIFN